MEAIELLKSILDVLKLATIAFGAPWNSILDPEARKTAAAVADEMYGNRTSTSAAMLSHQRNVIISLKTVVDDLRSVWNILTDVQVRLTPGFSIESRVVLKPDGDLGLLTNGKTPTMANITGHINVEKKSFVFNINLASLVLVNEPPIYLDVAHLNAKLFTSDHADQLAPDSVEAHTSTKTMIFTFKASGNFRFDFASKGGIGYSGRGVIARRLTLETFSTWKTVSPDGRRSDVTITGKLITRKVSDKMVRQRFEQLQTASQSAVVEYMRTKNVSFAVRSSVLYKFPTDYRKTLLDEIDQLDEELSTSIGSKLRSFLEEIDSEGLKSKLAGLIVSKEGFGLADFPIVQKHCSEDVRKWMPEFHNGGYISLSNYDGTYVPPHGLVKDVNGKTPEFEVIKGVTVKDVVAKFKKVDGITTGPLFVEANGFIRFADCREVAAQRSDA